MIKDDMLQKIKEQLLDELISKMSDSSADRMKPKGLGVEVEAADPEHLADGLDKAKDLLSNSKSLPDKSDEDRMADMSDKGNVGPGTDKDDDDDDDEEMMRALESMHKS